MEQKTLKLKKYAAAVFMKNNVSLIITMKGRSDKAARQMPSCRRGLVFALSCLVVSHVAYRRDVLMSHWMTNVYYFLLFTLTVGNNRITIRGRILLKIESISIS